MLRAENLVAGYGRVQVLNDVSIEVVPGRLTALLGANGAGKTTLLRTLSGLIPATSGQIFVDANLVSNSDDRVGVAHVPEGRGTFAHMTVSDNLRLGWYPRRRDRDGAREAIAEAIEPFGVLKSRLKQKAGSLSGGEQQMLAIARALVARPKYLLVDEPSLGLAPVVVADVFEVLSQLRESGLGILVVEQQAARVLRHADNAIVLQRGKVTYDGLASGLDRDALTVAYLGGQR